MLKALAAFAAISVNGQLNALSTPAPCCKDADECEDFMKLCLSGNRMYCNVLPCTSSSPSVVISDSCDPCPQGGSLINGKCVHSVPASTIADGLCPTGGYIFNPTNALCELTYPPVQFFTDCPSTSPSPMVVVEEPSSTPNKCCNDATDECLILARLCASGDLTACGFVPCAPSPSPVDYAPSSSPYATVPSLCFNPCTKGGIPYAYDSRTKTISCRIVADPTNGTCNSNYMMVNNTCVHEYTTLYSVQSCSPSPSMTASNTPSSSASKVVVSRSASNTPKIVDRESATPSMTPKIVPSSSASMTPKVVDRESSSPSMTPKIVERESSSPSMTPKIVERTVSPSARPSNVDVYEYSNRPVEPLYTRKPDCNFWMCPAEYEVTNVNGKVICKYYKSAEYNQITLPDGPEGQTGGFYNEYYCPRGTTLITIQGAVEAKKYWCEGFTDASWSACPSVSSTPSVTYNRNVPSTSPNRSSIADAASTVSLYTSRVSPRISPKFSRFPWFTPVMSKKPLFGTSINGALTFPQASIAIVDKLKELQVHLSCAFHVDVDKVIITSVVRNINGTKYDLPFDISNVEVPLIGCYRVDPSPSPALARMLQSVNGEIIVSYVMNDSTAEVLSVDPTVVQAAIASDPAIIDFASSMGSTTVGSSANAASSPSGDGISSSNTNFNAVTGIAVVFGAILAVVGVLGAAKYAQHRKRVAKNSKVIRFNDEITNNPLTYDQSKKMFTPTPAVNYIV